MRAAVAVPSGRLGSGVELQRAWTQRWGDGAGSRDKPTRVMARRIVASPQREAGRVTAVAAARQRGGVAAQRPVAAGR